MSESESGKPGSVDAQPTEGSTSTEAAPAEAKPASEPVPAGEPLPAKAPPAQDEEENAADADEDEDDEDEDDAEDDPVDLESRILCPDGSCIGVIGPDGRCKECGAVLPEKERAAAAAAAPAKQAGEKAAGEKPAPPSSSAESGDGDAPDFSERVLCSDGSCIGVIGPDGRCKECGKPYRGEPTD